MSCKLEKLLAINDLRAVKRVLNVGLDSPSEKSSVLDDDEWKNTWEWGNAEEGGTDHENRSTDQTWLQQCVVGMSPGADLLILAANQYAAFLTRKWDFNEESELKMKFYLSGGETLACADGEEITAILCLPLASQKRSAHGEPDWTCIIIGFSSGYLRMYTEKAELLLSQLLHEEPVRQLKFQTYNPSRYREFTEQLDDLVIVYSSAVVSVEGFSLFQTLRACRNQLARATAGKWETMDPPPLTYKKWGFQDQKELADCEHVGGVTPPSFDQMMGESIQRGSHGTVKSIIPASTLLVTVGLEPYIGFFCASEGTVQPILSEMAMAVASKLKTFITGGLLGFRGRTQQEDPHHPSVEAPTPVPMKYGIYDKRRQGGRIVLSPNKTMAAITDGFGRVILFDILKGLAVRMWKGYREAQCGWIETMDESSHPEHREGQVSKRAYFLVIYAPRRGIVEIWCSQQGPRVGAFNVGKFGRLLYFNYTMMGLNNTTAHNCKPMIYPCCLLDADGNIYSFAVPFHCALSGRNSKKARDLHLLKDLRTMLKDSDLNQDKLVSEIKKILLDLKTASIRQQAVEIILQNKFLTSEFISEIVSTLHSYLQNQDPDKLDFESKILLQICWRIEQLVALYRILEGINNKQKEKSPVCDEETEPKDVELFSSMFNLTDSEVGNLVSLASVHQTSTYSVGKHVTFADNQEVLVTLSKFLRLFQLSYSHLVKEDANENGSSVLPITVHPASSESELRKIGDFMFHAVIQSKETSDTTLHDALKKSGIAPKQLLEILLIYWLSHTTSLNKWKQWLVFQDLLKHITSLAVSLDESLLCGDGESEPIWWKTVKNLLCESTNSLSAYTAAIIAQSVAITLALGNNHKLASNPPSLASISMEQLVSATQLDSENVSQEVGQEETNLCDIQEIQGICMDKGPADNGDSEWESISLNTERWHFLVTQLEDVFVLSMLLNLLPNVPKFEVSLSSLLNSGQGAVTELVAKWAVTASIGPDLLTVYSGRDEESTPLFQFGGSENLDKERKDYSFNLLKGLLSQVRRRYPRSLEPDLVLINCAWEHLVQWNTDRDAVQHLMGTMQCLSRVNSATLCNGVGCMMWKTFIMKKFEALAKLMEKVGKPPKERLCRKELKMSDIYIEKFLDFCCQLLCHVLETSMVSESEPIPLFPVEELLQGQDIHGQTPLVTLALGQKSSNYKLVDHHLHLATAMLMVISFQMKSVRILSVYDTMGRNAFFHELNSSQSIKLNTDVIDTQLMRARTHFLLRVTSAIAESVPESIPDNISFPVSLRLSRTSSHSGICMSSPGQSHASRWFSRTLDLARGWGVSVDEVRRHYVCELYSGGYDSLAEEAMAAVADRVLLGSQLLLLAGQRVRHAIIGLTDTAEKLAQLSPTLSTWLKSLDTEGLRCTNPPLQNTAFLIGHVINCLPENHGEQEIAISMLETIQSMTDQNNINS